MLSYVTPSKKIRAQIGYFKAKNHVQTARESHDLNMASNSLALQISMQEYKIDCNTSYVAPMKQ